MKKVKSFIITSAVVSLIACGDDSKSSKSNAPEEPLREVPTIYDLGACTKDRNGDTVLVIDKAVEYLCIGNDWLDITTQSTDVPQPSESDGISSSDTQTPEHPSSINGDAENSSSSVADDPLNNNSSSSVKATYIEVAAQNKLTICDSSNIGLRALVLADSTYFTCKAKGWIKDSVYLGYEIVKTREDLGVCNTGNAKQRVLVNKDSIFFNCDSQKWVPETADGYIVKNASILGAAQKGPFKFDSPLMLHEVLLHNDALTYTGREYIDEISSNKGDFVIPKVNLVYPYAVLEVRGQWRNEISGEWSKDSMTLRALTDLTSRTEVNINLLTHLEYDRAVQLVSKGYSIFAAKKQAEYEIMTAFGFATTIEYSENLKTFVASTSKDHESNATLMAIALLFIGDRSEAEIVSAVNDFKRDMASDGTWNDEQAKADMADWAESFDGGSIRANVKSWNILTIPDYENYLTIFWNNAYELGGCSSTRSSVIVQNKNAKSKNYNVHYICKATSWQKATDYEKDTYQWADGEEGEVKKGNVTETYYVFEDGKWEVAKNESALGLCTEARSGEIGKVDTTYFVCKNKKWGKATVLEYDTYQFSAGEDGEVRAGKVNADKFYVYENGTWRASASEIENNLGACVTSREGVVGKSESTYYICKSKSWVTATALEYDTYGWTAGTEGEVKTGSVNAKNYYIYKEDKWQVASSIEKDLNGCTTSREGVVGKSGNTYYICKSKEWDEATALEYDTYGWTAGTDGEVKAGSVNADNYYIYKEDKWQVATMMEYDTYNIECSTDGTIVDGEINSANKYVCDADSFRIASALEISLNTGCVSYTENNEIKKHVSVGKDSNYICQNGIWNGFERLYETMIDNRNHKTYRVVKIGYQTWMAQNLDFEYKIKSDDGDDSISYGNYCNTDNCTIYGRYYTWAAAMDSAGIFSTNGKDCGNNKTCSPIYPVRGICPEGWHLPDTSEWRILFQAMNRSVYAMQAKGYVEWPKAIDTFAFSALPAGYTDVNGEEFYGEGVCAKFWNSLEYAWILGEETEFASFWFLKTTEAYNLSWQKHAAFSVRCVKDSE